MAASDFRDNPRSEHRALAAKRAWAEQMDKNFRKIEQHVESEIDLGVHLSQGDRVFLIKKAKDTGGANKVVYVHTQLEGPERYRTLLYHAKNLPSHVRAGRKLSSGTAVEVGGLLR